MKKIMIILMVLSIIFIGTVLAQGNLGFGVKGGLNMAKLTGDDAGLELDFEDIKTTDPGFIFGPIIGGFITYNLGDKLAIRPEFLYTVKGGSYEFSESMMEGGISLTLDGSMDMKMNWLDIPILVVYNLNDKIKIIVGPYLELYLNGKVKYDFTVSGTFEDDSYSESVKDNEDIKSGDITSPGFGLIFGGAFMLGNNLEVEARYSVGLTSLDEEENIKNSGIQLLLNYYLKK
jgi:hypothetical protein